VVATSDLPKKPGSLALHPNGTDVVVGLSNGDLLTFSVDGDALKKGELVKNHRKNVTSIVYSSDGALMASADTERCIFLWDTTVSPVRSASNRMVFCFCSRNDAFLFVWDTTVSSVRSARNHKVSFVQDVKITPSYQK
jgi:WD40 repeat protein